MDVNKLAEIKDGDSTIVLLEAPSILDLPKHKLERTVKKKRRRGKTKWKISKPFLKVPWYDRRKMDNTKRNNRFRKIALSKTQAPFNNNQFLMEIHKPEPENNFHIFRPPSARTRDSSFSVDSEENYFYSLPEDEEEYLTKEFSSVYEDAQCERLSNMSKNELIQEYLLLEAKYDNLVKRTERSKQKDEDDMDSTVTDKEMTVVERDSVTDRDTSHTSVNSNSMDESSAYDVMQRLKDQEQEIRDLQLANEKLLVENNHLRRNQGSSEDSESDSSSSSDSCSSSSCSSPEHKPAVENGDVSLNENTVTENGDHFNTNSPQSEPPRINGFHSPTD